MEVIYNALNVKIAKEHYEIVSAWLAQLPFESFFEDEDKLVAYYVKEDISEQQIKECIEGLVNIPDIDYHIETIENKNWNEEWEASFQPVNIDDQVCIRADFHPTVPGVKYDIVINPKMAFGTAHHETTYMMMQEILALDVQGLKILDYGCGTSILAILAAQKGASDIIANDYDINSVNNSIENIKLNESVGIDVRHGDLDVIEESDFDLILANINRHVLTQNVELVAAKLNVGGILLMSGILETDRQLIEDTYKPFFELESVKQKGEWLCFRWVKK